MTDQRSYHDSCGMAHALDLVGERWALLVVRELVLGPKRFTDLRADLPGVSSNVLTTRLGELERAGVVHRRKLPPPAAAWVYELTEWGHELEPIMQQLGRWGARSPAHPIDQHLSVASAVMSLRTNFDATAAAGVRGRYQVRIGEDVFRAEVDGGRFSIERGEAARPDAVIEVDTPTTLALLLYVGRPLRAAVRAGQAKIGGDPKAAARFLTLFSLPAPAVMPASI